MPKKTNLPFLKYNQVQPDPVLQKSFQDQENFLKIIKDKTFIHKKAKNPNGLQEIIQKFDLTHSEDLNKAFDNLHEAIKKDSIVYKIQQFISGRKKVDIDSQAYITESDDSSDDSFDKNQQVRKASTIFPSKNYKTHPQDTPLKKEQILNHFYNNFCAAAKSR